MATAAQMPPPPSSPTTAETLETDMDTANKHLVGAQGGNIVILNPPRGPISKHDALVLAAWLVTLAANDEGSDFDRVLRAVQE